MPNSNVLASGKLLALFVASFARAGVVLQAQSVTAPTVLYAQSTTTQNTNSATYVPIPGLSLTLPPSGGGATSALITLNVPDIYVARSNSPDMGTRFAIQVNGAAVYSGAYSGFGYGGYTTGRHAMTLVVKVPLKNHPQIVIGRWLTLEPTYTSSTIVGPASISALLCN